MTLHPAGSEISFAITWLEMTEPHVRGQPPLPSGSPAALLKADAPPYWYFIDLYEAVGRDYAWEDKIQAAEADVTDWLSQPTVEMFTLMREGWPHGFFLLDRQDETCDLSYFGLTPGAIGKGLGRYLLETAVYTGWSYPGIKRMTVNTNTLDHPRALALYQSVGFSPYNRTNHTRVLLRDLDRGQVPD